MQDLLFLTQRIPFPPNKGDKIRSYHVLQALSTRFRVHLGCFVDDPLDWQHADEVRRHLASCQMLPLSRRAASLRSGRALLTGSPLSLPFYYDRRMADWVKTVVRTQKPAAAYVFSGPMAQYLSSGPRPGRFVMDFVDVDSQKWKDYARARSGPAAALYRREGAKLLQFERKIAGLADASLFVSEPERALFESLAPESAGRTYAIGNGTDSDYFSPERVYPAPFETTHPTLLFTGAMDYWPNIEAMRWFTDLVWPLLRRRFVDLRLVIVGLNPTDDIIALGRRPGITVTGRVPDVRPYLAHASAVIAPLLTARGIQNKVLEAMSMARPVVATRQAWEGIQAAAPEHLLIADSAAEFCDAITQAITDPGAAAMGLAARAQILRAHSWQPPLQRLLALIEAAPAFKRHDDTSLTHPATRVAEPCRPPNWRAAGRQV